MYSLEARLSVRFGSVAVRVTLRTVNDPLTAASRLSSWPLRMTSPGVRPPKVTDRVMLLPPAAVNDADAPPVTAIRLAASS